MTQFLNNIWYAISTDNTFLLNLSYIPTKLIENYLFIELFLNSFDINVSKKNKLIYIVLISLIILETHILIPYPFSIIVNCLCIFILIRKLFKMSTLQTLWAIFLSSCIFCFSNMFLQKPYLTLLNINFDYIRTIPIYKITYSIILYSFIFLITKLIKTFRHFDFSFEELSVLDPKTLGILYFNIAVGFVALCIQLIITIFYINIVPIFITLLHTIVLIFFLLLSIYTFTRIIKLSATTRDLSSVQNYYKNLEALYYKVKGFQHDFINIVSTVDGYIQNDDIENFKTYFESVKKDCKIISNLSMLDPGIINNHGIYSLLNNKYHKALDLDVYLEIKVFADLENPNVNMYEFSRMLGILLDNAIEEAVKCEDKKVIVTFRDELKNNRCLITIENTYSNKNVDINQIFQKGISGKENHSGIGLWEVRNYLNKSKNLDLFTTKNDVFFKQELSIYGNA